VPYLGVPVWKPGWRLDESGLVSVIPSANARQFFWQEGEIPLRYANLLIYIRRDRRFASFPKPEWNVLFHVAVVRVAQMLPLQYCMCHGRDVRLLEIKVHCCRLIAPQISRCTELLNLLTNPTTITDNTVISARLFHVQNH
jgi:hypothetical protein